MLNVVYRCSDKRICPLILRNFMAKKNNIFSRNLIQPLVFCCPKFLLYTVISKKGTENFVGILIVRILCSHFLMQSVIFVFTL
jgi:hypothetical protein